MNHKAAFYWETNENVKGKLPEMQDHVSPDNMIHQKPLFLANFRESRFPFSANWPSWTFPLIYYE